MSMKVKMKDIIKFGETPLGMKKFTPKMNLAIAINAAAAEPILKGYNESYRNLMDEYLEKDEEGEPIIIEEGDQKFYKFTDVDKFNEAYNEMLEEDVELTVKTFKESEIVKCGEKEGLDVPTVAELAAMMFMIDIKE